MDCGILKGSRCAGVLVEGHTSAPLRRAHRAGLATRNHDGHATQRCATGRLYGANEADGRLGPFERVRSLGRRGNSAALNFADGCVELCRPLLRTATEKLVVVIANHLGGLERENVATRDQDRLPACTGGVHIDDVPSRGNYTPGGSLFRLASAQQRYGCAQHRSREPLHSSSP